MRSRASRIMMPISSGRPSGSGATAPKSMTAIRPSGSSMKLPGWASPCIIPTRAGASKVSSNSRVPMMSRCSTVPERMISDIGMPPSIHSLTITLGALPTTWGIRKRGWPS